MSLILVSAALVWLGYLCINPPKSLIFTMNWKKHIALLTAGLLVFGMVASSCADPRKNCNHPDHGKYMSEKLSKKRGLPGR